MFKKRLEECDKKFLVKEKTKINEEKIYKEAENCIIRKAKDKIFIDALRSDVYFNALRVNYGYCITCHKSQGGEWKKVFVKCKTKHPSKLSQDYFRWLYTAITRSSGKLFVLDSPYTTPTSTMKIR